MTDAPSSKENTAGFVYWAFSVTLLSPLLVLGNAALGSPLPASAVNMVCFSANFLAAVLCFRKFLVRNIRCALDRMFPTVYYAVLGYLGSQVLGRILYVLLPVFSNVNDGNVIALVQEAPGLMTVGTVLLVPVAEEVFCRGMMFRSLFDRNKVLAYTVSMVVFSATHVVGYIGAYPLGTLMLCFLQYLPAGYCLCWCYRQSGNLISPILMHMIVNATGIYAMMR